MLLIKANIYEILVYSIGDRVAKTKFLLRKFWKTADKTKFACLFQQLNTNAREFPKTNLQYFWTIKFSLYLFDLCL